MEKQKRVAAIHDISGFGKCSLTVALPILSAAGIETACMPTAVLSTHTGGIEGFTYRDLTDDILPFANHWKSLGLHFDSIYTGFLGSFEQIDIVSDVIDMLKSEDTLVLIDPVMADHGELYKIFGPDFPQGMKKISAKADLLIPNITEACLMTGYEYKNGPYDKEYIEGLLAALETVCAKKIVLTGVYFDEKKLGAAAYDVQSGKISYAFTDRVDGFYHGTGDVFGSALLAGILNKKTLHDSMQIAVDFTAKAIARTKAAGTDIRFGVDFEHELGGLIDAVK